MLHWNLLPCSSFCLLLQGFNYTRLEHKLNYSYEKVPRSILTNIYLYSLSMAFCELFILILFWGYILFVLFVWPHMTVLRSYSWLGSWGFFLVSLEDYMVYLGWNLSGLCAKQMPKLLYYLSGP